MLLGRVFVLVVLRAEVALELEEAWLVLACLEHLGVLDVALDRDGLAVDLLLVSLDL